MSLDQIPVFWTKVADDAQLQSRVADLPEDGLADALSTVAGEIGVDCRAEDFKTFEEVLRFWDQLQNDEELQSRVKNTETTGSEAAADQLTRIGGSTSGSSRPSGGTSNRVAVFCCSRIAGPVASRSSARWPRPTVSTSVASCCPGSPIPRLPQISIDRSE